ncbi:hypothetical protein TTHERM_01443840 (macronuclear) [Tetrahymena thermophila SB210]|uniref:Uncharacterized protein n=1 Tax=Tetrahymena thermophila (strain SB210) TaxID=312017 RepID=Q229B9_TETTS|nr:hypothetical protein TTHERM_01443840 [Tetrahymena thermophila SB210]EAR81886.1 hypothetical protein TTHERM_01443840 [Tetrahymena thermophila SB210]|eukprot:XP_001029549.1 hypothetical protein TTHERM_01443840 [Tetrahymena thermophila SB210]
MSKNQEDKIPEIQASYVLNFLKAKIGKDTVISSNFRKEFSKCLSLFLFYLATIAKHGQGDLKKKINKNILFKALSDIGFEDFAEQLEEMQIDFKQNPSVRTQQKQASKNEHEDDLLSEHKNQKNELEEEDKQDDIQSDASGQDLQEVDLNQGEQQNIEQNEKPQEFILDQINRMQPQLNKNDEYEEIF